jgi:hypothetical protein
LMQPTAETIRKRNVLSLRGDGTSPEPFAIPSTQSRHFVLGPH